MTAEKQTKISSEQEQKMLNPQITSTLIGTRNQREIKIYPLSLGDQLEVSEIISNTLKEFFSKSDNDLILMTVIIQLIQENLGKILTFCTDFDGNELLKEITNLQASEIVKIVYEANYKVPGKNVKSLWMEIQEMFPSQGQSQPFVNDMDTELTISTENDSKMED